MFHKSIFIALMLVVVVWSQNLNLSQGLIGHNDSVTFITGATGGVGARLVNNQSYLEFLESPQLKLTEDFTISLYVKDRKKPFYLFDIGNVLTIVDSTFSGFTVNGVPVPSITETFGLAFGVVDTSIKYYFTNAFMQPDSGFYDSTLGFGVFVEGVDTIQSNRHFPFDTLWHQIVFQRKGSTYSLSFDGILIGSNTKPVATIVGTHIFVGAPFGSGGASMDVDAVKISNDVTSTIVPKLVQRTVVTSNSRIVTDLLGRIVTLKASRVVVSPKMRMIEFCGSE